MRNIKSKESVTSSKVIIEHIAFIDNSNVNKKELDTIKCRGYFKTINY